MDSALWASCREREMGIERLSQVGMQESVTDARAARALPQERHRSRRSIHPEQSPGACAHCATVGGLGVKSKERKGRCTFPGNVGRDAMGWDGVLCVCADGLGLKCGMRGFGVWRGFRT